MAGGCNGRCRHPQPRRKEEAEPDRAQNEPEAVPSQPPGERRHRQPGDNDAKAHAGEMQPQFRAQPFADQPVQHKPGGQQQACGGGKAGQEAQRCPQPHIARQPHGQRRQGGDHQPGAVEHEFGGQAVDAGGDQRAAEIARIIEGRQPPATDGGKARLVLHDRQHRRVGEAGQPDRQHQCRHAGDDDPTVIGSRGQKAKAGCTFHGANLMGRVSLGGTSRSGSG